MLIASRQLVAGYLVEDSPALNGVYDLGATLQMRQPVLEKESCKAIVHRATGGFATSLLKTSTPLKDRR